jgi:RNA-directed DNA polymerase
MVAYLIRHLHGHIQYYGVSGNSQGVSGYRYVSTGLLFKWLNRRSQRRSLTWKRFYAVIKPLLPTTRIIHDLYSVPSLRRGSVCTDGQEQVDTARRAFSGVLRPGR